MSVVHDQVVWADEASPFTGAQVKTLLDANERMKKALDELEDGACNAPYGPGCDCRCKGVAWKALADVADIEAGLPSSTESVSK